MGGEGQLREKISRDSGIPWNFRVSLTIFIIYRFVLFFERVSLYSPSWSRTCNDPCASVSQVEDPGLCCHTQMIYLFIFEAECHIF